MTKKINLNWGETPWDDLSREELLKEVWKMFSALQSASGVISQCRNAQFWHRIKSDGEYNPDDITKQLDEAASQDEYWGKGTGARAYEKVNQAMERSEKYESEDIYRSFFRYADDLLFERLTAKIGWGWVVCSKCGQMIGETSDGESDLGKPCRFGEKDCDGVFRKLEWSDLGK